LSACTYQRGGGARVAKAQQKGPVPTGSPLVLGFVTQEDSPTGSFPETRRAAQAAVGYVNEDLGGVEGRPLQLRTCRTDGSPEASQACARQLLAARPLTIIGGSTSVPVRPCPLTRRRRGPMWLFAVKGN